MDMQDLLDLLADEQCKTKEEFFALRKKAFEIFDQLPPEEQEIILEDNAFEPLSMICSAFEE